MVLRKALLAIIGVLALQGSALAEDAYPSRPVRLIVGFASGSTADVTARIISRRLSDILGKRVLVENRPGAGGTIATEYVATAKKDGYTLLFGTVAATINATLAPSKKADFAKDFAPVTLISSIPNVLVVNPSVKVNDVKGLIALAKAEPNKLFYGSAGIGSSPHLTAELFKQMAGIKMTAVQYQGSAQAVTDLIAGRVQVMFSPASTVMSMIREGRLRALATTERKRASIAPDLPTISEAGLPGFDTGVWVGTLAPSGTPQKIIEKLSAATNSALKAPDVVKQLKLQGMQPIGGSPEHFKTFIASELQRWAHVIHSAHISVKK